MKHIILASKNPVKARATLTGFQQMFPEEASHVHTVSVAAGLSNTAPSTA